jgi:hypothetical protein
MAHTYIASTYGRGSVMDYPAPRLTVDSAGKVDFREPYALGPGAFDVLAVRWGYGIFPPEHEADSLNAIVADGIKRGLIFLSDADARPDYASDPRVNLWDDASSPEAFLTRQLGVRRAAMRHFGLGNIAPGEPVATLQERFARLYFFHRFAAFATDSRRPVPFPAPANARPWQSCWGPSPRRSWLFRTPSSRCSARVRSGTSPTRRCSAHEPSPPSTSSARPDRWPRSCWGRCSSAIGWRAWFSNRRMTPARCLWASSWAA